MLSLEHRNQNLRLCCQDFIRCAEILERVCAIGEFHACVYVIPTPLMRRADSEIFPNDRFVKTILQGPYAKNAQQISKPQGVF